MRVTVTRENSRSYSGSIPDPSTLGITLTRQGAREDGADRKEGVDRLERQPLFKPPSGTK